MVSLWLQETAPGWFGVASYEDALVATVFAKVRPDAERSLRGCVPRDAECRLEAEGSAYQRAVVAMLADLERGDESRKCFQLSPVWVPEPLREVLRAAAAIPLGYVGTYGDIGDVGGVDARTVGRVMAANPLYPIVACHRVVGSDLSLIGYGGSQRPSALRAKLARLRAEARGYDEERAVEAVGGLRVSPVEWAIVKAVRDGVAAGSQLELW